MRVTGGNARGRQIKAPKGQAVRPTAGRVKEALFNILGQDLSGARVLDLFAGTGNLTIEALSRGAVRAVLVDSAERSAVLIRENLSRLELLDRCTVWVMPVARALRLLAGRGELFDLVFLDPPYNHRQVGSALKSIGAANILAPSSIVVVEHSIREPIGPRIEGLVLKDERRYGDTLLSFLIPASRSSLSNEGHPQDVR
ncbi:MAG TPA: 16S rRNA (guanine(966)-N(2))-methyltransferase RsmD [Candidatus Binatia bacterium]|jgi:16S rRNA (guanine(966)-N(2))-methyltransferase RsmD